MQGCSGWFFMALGVGLLAALAGCITDQDPAVDGPVPALVSAEGPAPGAADVPADRPLRAAFLVVDGVYNSELMAPYDILHHTPFHTEPHPGVEVFTVSQNGERVVTFEGLFLTPHYSFSNAPRPDILVVPSTIGSMDEDLKNEVLMEWVRRVGSQASYVVSLCDGAFVLAAAGLLDGHAVTTFPTDQGRFAEMFPELDLRKEPGFVHDGKVLTSQGGALSYDVALYLVAHLFGNEVAAGVGRGLIIAWPPAEAQGISVESLP